MYVIKPVKSLSSQIRVPGSKSYTHRVLIASALSDGVCSISNALKSEDTDLTIKALKRFGVEITEVKEKLLVHGSKGRLTGGGTIFLANSGTSMRFLTAVASLAEGETVLTGNDRMKERPLGDLILGLQRIGVLIESLESDGYPPVCVKGGIPEGGDIKLECTVSSQFLSAILLIAPLTRQGIRVKIIGEPVSKPYIDMTLEVMKLFGIMLSRNGYTEFSLDGMQSYRAGDFTIEPDASNASYFWAAAAVMGESVKVMGLSGESSQGDMKFLHCLERMGCIVENEQDGIRVTGASLRAIDVDMGDMPDMVPTVAVVAAFADGVTRIRNIAHLRVKECDRISALANELKKMGIRVRQDEGVVEVSGGNPRGVEIETYNDHRIAMSFSICGLKVPGVSIRNEGCVAKSFPSYWEVFESLYSEG
jgi:3-phosphoshikimate 1-carboxyvinyltransferase